MTDATVSTCEQRRTNAGHEQLQPVIDVQRTSCTPESPLTAAWMRPSVQYLIWSRASAEPVGLPEDGHNAAMTSVDCCEFQPSHADSISSGSVVFAARRSANWACDL